MIKLESKKPTIIFIAMVIGLSILIINSVYLNIQNQRLKNEIVRQMDSEWYALLKIKFFKVFKDFK